MWGDPTAGADRHTYLFALAPGVVVLVVAPVLGSLPDRSDCLSSVDSCLLAGLSTPLRRPANPHLLSTNPDDSSPVVRSRTHATAVPRHGARGRWGLALDALVVVGYAALLWVVYHLLTVYREEPELQAAFGAEYEHSREEVSRWVPPSTPHLTSRPTCGCPTAQARPCTGTT
jgi:hypothetical protein